MSRWSRQKRGCVRKVAYETRADAEAALPVVRVLTRPPGWHIYECPYCRKFHLGGPKKRDDVTGPEMESLLRSRDG